MPPSQLLQVAGSPRSPGLVVSLPTVHLHLSGHVSLDLGHSPIQEDLSRDFHLSYTCKDPHYSKSGHILRSQVAVWGRGGGAIKPTANTSDSQASTGHEHSVAPPWALHSVSSALKAGWAGDGEGLHTM